MNSEACGVAKLQAANDEWMNVPTAIELVTRSFDAYGVEAKFRAEHAIWNRLMFGTLKSKVCNKSDYQCNRLFFGRLIRTAALQHGNIIPPFFWQVYHHGNTTRYDTALAGDFRFVRKKPYLDGSASGVQISRNGLPLAGNAPTFAANVDDEPSKCKVRGRPKGAGGWAGLDEPIVKRMREMMALSPGMTAFNAAAYFTDQAAGNASLETKQRRLAERYRQIYGI